MVLAPSTSGSLQDEVPRKDCKYMVERPLRVRCANVFLKTTADRMNPESLNIHSATIHFLGFLYEVMQDFHHQHFDPPMAPKSRSGCIVNEISPG